MGELTRGHKEDRKNLRAVLGNKEQEKDVLH